MDETGTWQGDVLLLLYAPLAHPHKKRTGAQDWLVQDGDGLLCARLVGAGPPRVLHMAFAHPAISEGSPRGLIPARVHDTHEQVTHSPAAQQARVCECEPGSDSFACLCFRRQIDAPIFRNFLHDSFSQGANSGSGTAVF